MDLQNEMLDVKRRLNLVETRLSSVHPFLVVVGQLRDLQFCMHNEFADMDKRFDSVVDRFDNLEARLDSLPRFVMERLSPILSPQS